MSMHGISGATAPITRILFEQSLQHLPVFCGGRPVGDKGWDWGTPKILGQTQNTPRISGEMTQGG